ncbi:MAG: methyltransferase domain-containing protein [Alphaproteobacteria bacterium]|nr:methyltransferase domain-containing protein [Alphaproteobacteria bacterium]
MAEDTVLEKKKAEGAGQARALGLFLLKRYEEAVAVYDELLEKEPDNIDFWQNRINSLLQYSPVNASFFDQMIKRLNHLSAQGYMCLADVLTNLNREDEALVFVDGALKRDGENVEAYVLKALLLVDLKRFDELYSLMQTLYPRLKTDERILCLTAFYASLFGNARQAGYILKKALKRNRSFVLQNKLFYSTLLSIGEAAECIDFGLEALNTDADNPVVWSGLAQANMMLGDYQSADEAFNTLSSLIDLSEAERYQWEEVLINLEEYEDAFNLLLDMDESSDTWLLRLQNLLDEMCSAGLVRESCKYAEYLKKNYKKYPELFFICDTVLNKDRKEGKPLSLVRLMSDAGASDMMDKSAGLSYDLPVLLERTLDWAQENVGKSYDVLDLGCGTGAMAAVLENYSRPDGSLTGVDISSEVLEYAANQGRYTALEKDNLVSFCRLKENARRYDLIVCMNVLSDFADLSSVFKAVHAALKEDGLFVFSVLPATENNRSFKFDSGVFYHHPDYVSSCLKQAGLQKDAEQSGCLYKDESSPCFVVAARKKK